MTRKIRFNVAGDPHGDQPTVQPDNPAGATPLSCVFESPNRLATTDIPTINTGAATVFYQNRQKSFRVILPPLGQFELEASDPQCLPPEYNGDADKVALHYGPVVPSGVHIVDDHFEQDGKRWIVKGVDGFCDHALLVGGNEAQLRDACKQTQDLGGNLRRVFGCMKNIVAFDPQAIGEPFFQTLPELFSIYGEYGLFGEYDVLPDTGYWGKSLGWCQGQWARVCDTLAPINNRIVSLTNEYDHGGNLVGSPNDYPRPGIELVSQGSAVSDAPPPRPGWGIREFHCLKNWPKIFLFEDMLFNREGVDANGATWGPRKPTYLSECFRFNESDPYTDERLARTLAFESLAFGEGMVFHNDFGKYSQLMQPRTARCAKVVMDILGSAN